MSEPPPNFADLTGMPVGQATSVAVDRSIEWLDKRLTALEEKIGKPWPPDAGDRFPPPQTIFEVLHWLAGKINYMSMLKR